MGIRSRVIVIGGGGFVGGSILKKCLAMGEDCVSITRSDVDLSCEISSQKLTEIISSNDRVVFAAAKAPAKNFADYQSNINMVKNFIDSCLVNTPRYILNISSDAVFSDQRTPITEDSPMVPNSYHGLMHSSREILLRLAGFSLANLRPTLIYGRGDPHNSYGPNRFYRLAKKEEEINLFGEGEELRDHVHIEDVGRLAYKMLDGVICEDLNAVSGQVISFFDIAKLIKEELGSDSKINITERKVPMPHNGYRAFQNKKVRNLFGSFDFKSFEYGLKHF